MKQQSRSSKLTDSEINPCLEEYKKSLNCLSRHNGDREYCIGPFSEYRGCKKFWGDVKKKRLDQGIKPPMPGLAERNQFKQLLGDKLPYAQKTDTELL